MNYSSVIKQLGPTIDLESTGESFRATSSSTLIKDIRGRVTEKLRNDVDGYGIKLMDFAIVDRQFKGEIAATVDKFISRAIRAHVEGTVCTILFLMSGYINIDTSLPDPVPKKGK